MPINPLGYSCIKKLQRDNLWHAYNEPINFYSADKMCIGEANCFSERNSGRDTISRSGLWLEFWSEFFSEFKSEF